MKAVTYQEQTRISRAIQISKLGSTCVFVDGKWIPVKDGVVELPELGKLGLTGPRKVLTLVGK